MAAVDGSAVAEVSKVEETIGTSSPAVEVTPGRINDSEKMRTCHQCRQKRRECVPLCKRLKKGKPCPLMFCQKCLLNRYGEKLEEVEKLEDWSCPKCRGICNCSFCMKKKGFQPTGILTHTAKAAGFTSVLDLLHGKGSEILEPRDMAKDTTASSSSSPLSKKKDAESNEEGSTIKKKTKGSKRSKGTGNDESQVPDATSGGIPEAIPPKDSTEENNENVESNPSERPAKKRKHSGKHGDNNGNVKAKLPKAPKLRKPATKSHGESRKEEIVLPIGSPLVEVAGIELPEEDIGAALQFLEFCNAFSQVLDINKGQPECVLRDIARGRLKRHGVHSAFVEFSIKLLSLIEKDTKKKGDTWLQTLSRCIEESQGLLKDFPLEFLESGSSGFDNLDPSTKLKILNFICDELLCTEELRKCIDEVATRYDQDRKEKKGRILEAKKKEKLLKQKAKDDMAKAILSAQDGAPLSIQESEGVIAETRAEEDRVHAELLASLEVLPKKNQRSDAVRTDPVMLGSDGNIFRKSVGYNNSSNIILQDIGDWDSVTLQDKWFIYNEEEEKVVDKYIASLRNQKRKRRRKGDTTSDHVIAETNSELPNSSNELGDNKGVTNLELPNNAESQQCLALPEAESASAVADQANQEQEVKQVEEVTADQ